MTEAEWRDCTDSLRMLDFLEGKTSNRKLRLFAVGCCRNLWHALTDDRSRKAVEVAERFADRRATQAELKTARTEAQQFCHLLESNAKLHQEMGGWAAFAAPNAASSPRRKMSLVAGEAIAWSCNAGERQSSITLLRCVFNPYCPVTIDPAILTWKDSTIPKLAGQIYLERAFDRLPVLADALQEAGCANEDILSHCRGQGPHTRGCWVIDLLTGRE